MLLKKILVFLFKCLSAAGIGLFLAILGQVLIDYRYFSFMFILLTAFFAFFTLTKKMQFLGVLVIDLIFTLIVLLIWAYIYIADKGNVV